MPLVRAHSFEYAFRIHFPRRAGPTGTVLRRAAMHWLLGRLPGELASISYNARDGAIRVEMIARFEQTDADRNRYIETLKLLLHEHLERLDVDAERKQLDGARADLAQLISSHRPASPEELRTAAINAALESGDELVVAEDGAVGFSDGITRAVTGRS